MTRRKRDLSPEPKRIRWQIGGRRRRGDVNPRWRVLDSIRDEEVKRGIPPGGGGLPRQRDADGRTPLEPPYHEDRYWGPKRFFTRRNRNKER